MIIIHPDGYEHMEIFAFIAVLNSLALRTSGAPAKWENIRDAV